MKTTTVVRITTGLVVERVLQPLGKDYYHVWEVAHLRKDGQPPQNRGSDGVLDGTYYGGYQSFALYDAGTEAIATPIRERIASLSAQLEATTKELRETYARHFAEHKGSAT